MTFSIIHNGYQLDKIEMDYINSTLVDNWNSKLSVNKSKIAVDSKLLELKKERFKQLLTGINKASEIVESKTFETEEKFLKDLESSLLNFEFWKNFFKNIQETAFEDSLHYVTDYLNKTLRMTVEEYNYIFPKGWSIDNSFAERLNFLVENNFSIPEIKTNTGT